VDVGWRIHDGIRHICVRIDQSAHDFLKAWVVDKQPNDAIAYFSRRSYPCLEALAQKKLEVTPCIAGEQRDSTQVAINVRAAWAA
jgi:hypothetical protein